MKNPTVFEMLKADTSPPTLDKVHERGLDEEILDTIAKYMRNNGFTGLCQADCECACELSDLAPCDELGMDCYAGYKVDTDSEHDALWVVQKKKPK